jgi:HAD superfamily hydrolase (TIGR01458 family)
MNPVRGWLLDVEGVLVADKRYRAVETAIDFVQRVRDRGMPLQLITNNTTDPSPALVEKLNRAGYTFTADDVLTCTAAAVTRLRQRNASRCLVLGVSGLRRFFADEGFLVTEEEDVDAVVVGMDTDLTYERLRLACTAVHRHGAVLIALHRNRLYSDAQGRVGPSVGPIVEAIAYATQAEPELIGKPSHAYYGQALERVGLSPEAVMVVSDDPFSDLAGARRMGMRAAFVLTGKYADPAVVDRIEADQRPNVTVDRIGDLLNTEWFASP